MVIGFLSSAPFSRLFVLLALTFVLVPVLSHADDVIKKKDGSVVTGQILSVSGDGADKQVMVGIRTSSGGMGKIPCYVSDIQSVDMATPADVAKVKGAEPATVIATLEPLIKNYAGLPANWVVDAMGQLAQAYSASGKSDLASATYSQIDTLYPGSKYHLQAVAGKALISLQQGKVDDALAQVQPLIDEANKNLSPSQAEGGLYASAFLVYGQVLEAQKKPAQALEAYLTVKTMFYQNADLADQADQLAKKLRDQNPGLGVD